VELTPPAELPTTIEIDGTTYVQDRVEPDVDVDDLVEIDVIETEETTIAVYVEPGVEPGPATPVYAVAEGSDVVVSYVPAPAGTPGVGGMVPNTGVGSAADRGGWDPAGIALLAAAVALMALAIRRLRRTR
jgi:hypothetical protein